MNDNPPPFGSVEVIGGLIALCFMALAAIVFVSPGPEADQRLGLFFGLVGIGVAALAGLVKSSQASRNTNGALDARITAAVYQAMEARRMGDSPAPGIDAAPAADPTLQ